MKKNNCKDNSLTAINSAINLFSQLTYHQKKIVIAYLNDLLGEPSSGLSSFLSVLQ